MARETKPNAAKSNAPKSKIQHYAAPPGMPDAQGDVYEDVKLDDEHDPGAYLGDQYIMLGDDHPEGPWNED